MATPMEVLGTSRSKAQPESTMLSPAGSHRSRCPIGAVPALTMMVRPPICGLPLPLPMLIANTV